MRKPRICIVAPNSYPLFQKNGKAPFGGSEVRAALLARSLARRGNVEVAVVVYDHGQPEVEEAGEGLRIWCRRGDRVEALAAPIVPHAWWHRSKLPVYRRGTAGQRFLWLLLAPTHALGRPLLSAYRRARRWPYVIGYVGEFAVEKKWAELYDRIDADIYTAAPGGTYVSTEVAFYCRRRGKPFVYLAASDADYDPGYRKAPKETGVLGMAGYMHLYAIENAAAHVVQSRHQSELLETHFHRRSDLVLGNPVDTRLAFPRRERADTVLWVGKSSWVKRPEHLLALARRLPSARFVMVMNETEREPHRRLVEEARALPNLELIEYVRYEEIERLFAEAALLVNTSDFEGFPNTFLQAGKYGVPIVSLSVDPEAMLSRHGGGIVCGRDLDRLESAVRELLTSPERRRALGEAARAYVLEHHDMDKIVARLEAFLLERARKAAA